MFCLCQNVYEKKKRSSRLNVCKAEKAETKCLGGKQKKRLNFYGSKQSSRPYVWEAKKDKKKQIFLKQTKLEKKCLGSKLC